MTNPTTNILGAKHWVGLSPEVTPGTPLAAVLNLFVDESLEMNANPTPIKRKSYLGTGVELPSRAGWIKPTGKVSVEAMASQPHPWYWLLGHVTSTQPAVSTDPTVYLHTITDDALEATPQNGGDSVSLTAQGNLVFDQATQPGVKLSKIKLIVTPGEVAKLEIEWMALNHTPGATLGTMPAAVTDVLVCTSVGIKVAGSSVLNVDSLDYEYTVNHEQLPTLIAGGTGTPQVIRRKDPAKGTGSIKWLDFPVTQLAAFLAQTPFSLVVELDGANISHSYNKFLRLTLPACQYTGGLTPQLGASVVTGDANFESFFDTTTSQQIKVEAQNTLVTITT